MCAVTKNWRYADVHTETMHTIADEDVDVMQTLVDPCIFVHIISAQDCCLFRAVFLAT